MGTRSHNDGRQLSEGGDPAVDQLAATLRWVFSTLLALVVIAVIVAVTVAS
jgi:hypothetical protein